METKIILNLWVDPSERCMWSRKHSFLLSLSKQTSWPQDFYKYIVYIEPHLPKHRVKSKGGQVDNLRPL